MTMFENHWTTTTKEVVKLETLRRLLLLVPSGLFVKINCLGQSYRWLELYANKYGNDTVATLQI